jgi:hypothetical protein
MDGKKKEPWRILVAVAAVIYIVVLWVKKDIVAIYTTMPREQIAPMIATTVAVSLLKVAALTGGILLVKWIAGKIMGRKGE